jgi:hypothetical protein
MLPAPLDRALAAEAVPVRPCPAAPAYPPVTPAQAARHRADLLAALRPERTRTQ